MEHLTVDVFSLCWRVCSQETLILFLLFTSDAHTLISLLLLNTKSLQWLSSFPFQTHTHLHSQLHKMEMRVMVSFHDAANVELLLWVYVGWGENWQNVVIVCPFPWVLNAVLKFKSQYYANGMQILIQILLLEPPLVNYSDKCNNWQQWFRCRAAGGTICPGDSSLKTPAVSVLIITLWF